MLFEDAFYLGNRDSIIAKYLTLALMEENHPPVFHPIFRVSLLSPNTYRRPWLLLVSEGRSDETERTRLPGWKIATHSVG